jgi:peptidoglycan/xylan/chitin deacetylase (PgdA/CDA1 family)
MWVVGPTHSTFCIFCHYLLGVSGESQREVRHPPRFWDAPAWARDNLVLRLLDNHGLRLEVLYDAKYLDGRASKPLIVIGTKERVRRLGLAP